MTREVKTIFLAGLTLCTFATIVLLKEGALIFPFPLNEFIFLFVAGQFAYWHYKKGAPAYLFLISALFGVLSNVFIWEILLSAETMRTFFGHPLIYWFYFLYATGVIATGILFLKKQTQLLNIALIFAGLITAGYGLYFDHSYYETAGFGLIMISNLISPVYKPLHLQWVLLFVLSLSETLTYLLTT